jgi:hypothetical protein
MRSTRPTRSSTWRAVLRRDRNDDVPLRRTGGARCDELHRTLQPIARRLRRGAAVVSRTSRSTCCSTDWAIRALASPISAPGPASRRACSRARPLVIAIEPNAKMRDAAAPDPNVEWRDGTAERDGARGSRRSTSSPRSRRFTGSIIRPALDEIVRILRPGGRAGRRLQRARRERSVHRRVRRARHEVRRPTLTEQPPRRTGWPRSPRSTRRARSASSTATSTSSTRRRAQARRQLVVSAAGRSRDTGETSEAMHAEIDDGLFVLPNTFKHDGHVNMHLVTLVVRVDTLALPRRSSDRDRRRRDVHRRRRGRRARRAR